MAGTQHDGTAPCGTAPGVGSEGGRLSPALQAGDPMSPYRRVTLPGKLILTLDANSSFSKHS